jgi:hypothetical protein
MAQSITLSSAGTATIVLNPVARTTSVIFSCTGGSSVTVGQAEVSLDDPSTTPAPTMTWALLSTTSGMTSSTALALLYTISSPVGAVRINSSASAGSSGVFTLKALQSVTS